MVAYGTGSTGTATPTFWDCYERVKDIGGLVTDEYEISENYRSLIEAIEEEFTCNGICKPGLFFFFRPVSEGPPIKACLSGF